MTERYNDGNRAFLQAFMARSAMSFEEAKPVLAAIFSANGNSVFPLPLRGADVVSFQVVY